MPAGLRSFGTTFSGVIPEEILKMGAINTYLCWHFPRSGLCKVALWVQK